MNCDLRGWWRGEGNQTTRTDKITNEKWISIQTIRVNPRHPRLSDLQNFAVTLHRDILRRIRDRGNTSCDELISYAWPGCLLREPGSPKISGPKRNTCSGPTKRSGKS